MPLNTLACLLSLSGSSFGKNTHSTGYEVFSVFSCDRCMTLWLHYKQSSVREKTEQQSVGFLFIMHQFLFEPQSIVETLISENCVAKQ